jgi:hypothetical protein
MLVTMGNPDLVSKLLALADGNLDMVQRAIRAAAHDGVSADLEDVVELIARERTTVAAATSTKC